MRFNRRRTEDPEVSLTALIDVVLLLLIFFMVSTTFVQDGRLKIQLPESSAVAEKRSADPVTIVVTAEGTYRVNDRALVNATAETLRAAIREVAPEARGQPVTIRADARASHQAVVTAMDVAGRLGFSQVNIATVNEQPGG
ncbi:MAG: biopolymer transporter ExbD [Steroidobacteraceae bacterium]|jgi:biopolymer transport protein ExbD|nr:biopolymer transporter ExbD [Steroidobacteraceae bacterium]